MKTIYLIISLLLFIGCDSKIDYVELKIPKKNPTSFLFNATIDSIKNVIKLNYSKLPLYDIVSGEEAQNVYSKVYISWPENFNDFFGSYSGRSKVYFSSDKNITYSYEMLIKLSKVSDEKTMVVINTIDPKIIIGTKFPYNLLPRSFHVPDPQLEQVVEPSTIEEYQVLLVIGEALGVKDQMPPLILPEQPKE